MEETLQQLLTEHGAEWGTVAGERVALHYGDIQVEPGHLTESVALIDLTTRGCLAVLGDDRVKFINGQVTNEVAGLRSGQGCYAALVNAKAKMQADLNIYRLENELILDFEPSLLETVTARLESHLVADRVTVVVVDQALDLLPLEVLLAPTEVTGDDREGLLLGQRGQLFFCAVREGANDDVAAVRRPKAGRHGLELARVQEVEHQRLDDVVPVMAQRDLGAAQLDRGVVEDPPPKAGAQRAEGLALGDLVQHHRVGVAEDDAVLVALGLVVVLQHVGREAGLVLVQGDGHDGEVEGRPDPALARDHRPVRARLPLHRAHRVRPHDP